jgi:RNA-binding protein
LSQDLLEDFFLAIVRVEYRAPHPDEMSMSKQDNKQLRAIGHKLKPVVTVAGKGLSESVVLEINRALKDHELIKVKLVVGGRDARTTIGEQICDSTGAEIVQSIGNILLLLRRTAEPDPKLSNLLKY